MPAASQQNTHRSLFNRQINISDTQTAIFATLAVTIALLLAQQFAFGPTTGFLVVSMLSVTGINTREAFKARLATVAKVILILITTCVLAILTKHNIFTTLLGAVLLAFSFGYWRKLFPNNWPDINIPASVVFFMALSIPQDMEIVKTTVLGCTLGFTIQLLLCILFSFKKSDAKGKTDQTVAAAEPKQNYRFGLDKDLFIYSSQLSLLLVIGLLVYRVSGYPYGYWLPFTVIIILQTSFKQTKKRIGDRIVGTLIGCVLGSVILFLHFNDTTNLIIIALNAFFFQMLVRQHYALAVIFITMFILLLLGSHSSDPGEIVLERLISTIAAGALVYISSFVFLRKRDNA
ncbi:FUSC family protein [Pontibacter harenae]|uniref:FUSC family protein n=1 Tax=Pontibacter harenae TaxID=2894083 RepID=UPI001E5C7A68|nr:FUSC family protein [Pontibacter harenae]MCC9166317.1 FUSC family protein [Pontibacter harenae]